MRISFFYKLFLPLLLSSLLLLIGMGVLINASFKEGLQQFLNQEEVAKIEQMSKRVASYYSDNYGWTRIKQSPHIWASLLQQAGELPPPKKDRVKGKKKPPRQDKPPRADRPPRPPQGKGSIFVPLGARVNLVSMDDISIIGPPENLHHIRKDQFLHRVPIMRHGEQVGWISIVQSHQVSNQLAETFLYSQTRHIFTITAVAILLTALVAFVLVRYFLKPLKALHKGAEEVQQGDLEYQVTHNGNDEIADLINAFNHLVITLKDQKQIRDQWLTDISHELRTPLAVLRSELEALQDGIRAMEPRYIESLHRQVITLTKLVNDLHALSLSDAGTALDTQSSTLDIVDMLYAITDSYDLRLSQKQIAMDFSAAEHPPVIVKADTKSLQQLFNNLLENSYRYTDENGLVRVSVQEADDQVKLYFEDSKPAVPDEALPKLFDRLYRVDKSRSRANGGSGLGLSICKNIVAAHNGTITADHSELGGLKLTISLPRIIETT